VLGLMMVIRARDPPRQTALPSSPRYSAAETRWRLARTCRPRALIVQAETFAGGDEPGAKKLRLSRTAAIR